MADNDFEDDLFADLYEDDAKPEPVKAEPASAPPVVNGSTSIKTDVATKSEPDAANGQDNTKAEEEEDDDDDIDINLGGNSDHQAAPQQNQQVDHGYSRGPPGGHKDDGKMFIGGLNWETTDESLKDYFSQFGEVLECTVMRDGASGRSRGFGFLTFKDARTVNVVMVKEHYLDGKIIDPKRAIPRDEQERTSKIFVGGVSQEASEGDFKEYFMQFGRVVDATLMMDKDTGRPRGFGFVTFDSEEAVERCLSMPLEILGKAIEVKKAQPRGNVRDEEGSHHGPGAKFRGGDNHNGGAGGYGNPNQQAMGGMGGMAGMTPQVMAQYWQRMQQYMAMMQQQQQQMQMGRGMGGMQGGMNPMMMQQFQAMQAAQQQGGGMGGMGGMGGGRSMSPGGMGGQGGMGGMGQMNPMMMQQMMAAQQGQHQGQGFNGNAGQMSPSGPQSAMSPTAQHQGMANQRGLSPAQSARAPSQQPTYSAYEQQQFEQQKYEAQAAQQGGAPHGNHHGGKKRQASAQPQLQQLGGPAPKFGQPTSWEGMYDDVPQPGQPNKKQRNSATPVAPNPNAPVGAPTGPKNAGKPGANYRGGGRGSRGGFHPYSR